MAWGASQSIGYGDIGNILFPLDVEELVRDASAGSNYTLLIMNNRSASVVGYIGNFNSYEGHFGVGGEGLNQGVNEPRLILNVINLGGSVVIAPQFEQVIAGVEETEGQGKMHSIFIDVDGNIHATGNNNMGQLCLGDDEPVVIPVQIDLPNDERAVSAAVGAEFTLIVTKSGRVYGCGSNKVGQLGLGNGVIESYLPEELNGLSNVRSISAGLDFSLIRTNKGLFVMGDNTYGET